MVVRKSSGSFSRCRLSLPSSGWKRKTLNELPARLLANPLTLLAGCWNDDVVECWRFSGERFMKRVLIAYDGSPGAETAIKDLAYGGLPDSVEAIVLTVADVWLPPQTGGEVSSPDPPDVPRARESADDARREAQRTAEQGAELLRQVRPTWKIGSSTRADSPGWGILAEATAWRAELVVIGSHGRAPLERFFVGSVSYKVAAEAACSVRVVRLREGSSEQPERILIGIDGSEDSARAVDEVSQQRWKTGTPVELVTVADAKLRSRVFARTETPEGPFVWGRTEDSMQALLETMRTRLASRGLTVHTHVFDGDPKATLLRYAADWSVDCIFLGARGMEHGKRLYLGTVASAVCSRAHCTVEIVRAPQGAGTASMQIPDSGA
jgi:nucleotide-binding universal stress UspA family protein